MKLTGKYDREAEAQLIALRSKAVCLIVIGGEKGNGFSVAEAVPVGDLPSVVPKLPKLLRGMADSIEAEIQQNKRQ